MGVIFENGGENRAFPKNWADIGLFLRTGPEKKTGILENGTEIREKGWDSEKGSSEKSDSKMGR